MADELPAPLSAEPTIQNQDLTEEEAAVVRALTDPPELWEFCTVEQAAKTAVRALDLPARDARVRADALDEFERANEHLYDLSDLSDAELADANRLHGVLHPSGALGLYESTRNPSGCDRLWCLRHLPELVPVAEPRIRAAEAARVRAQVAEEIRVELVCCDVYDRLQPLLSSAREAGAMVEVGDANTRGHTICYWGEASARIARQHATEPVGQTEGQERTEGEGDG